jgi:hypothetical protein
MVRQMTRREAFRLMGVVASLPLAAALPATGAEAVDNNVNPRIVWEPVEGNPVVQTTGTGPGPVRMFPTLLPMGHLIPNAIDAWYLWVWHHDTFPQLHLYTAPDAAGPYTERNVYTGPPSPGFPSNYQQSHFSSGDIVWDAARRRLICSVHSLRIGRRSANGESCQDSFLIESADGLTWSFLDGDNSPRLLCGEPKSIDSVHTGYGRLLRDLDGFLTTYNGRYWWIYRAQRHDAGDNAPTFYVPALASTPSLATYPWVKHGKAFDMAQASTGLFGIGSFVRAARKHSVYYAEGSALLAPSTQYLNTSGGLDFAWTGPGHPVPIPNASETLVAGGGANLIRDPVDGVQYLVQDALDLVSGGSQIRIYRSVVP